MQSHSHCFHLKCLPVTSHPNCVQTCISKGAKITGRKNKFALLELMLKVYKVISLSHSIALAIGPIKLRCPILGPSKRQKKVFFLFRLAISSKKASFLRHFYFSLVYFNWSVDLMVRWVEIWQGNS